MTRLAIVKAQLEETKRRLSDSEIAASLALTTTADANIRVKDPSNGHYKIAAYGLTRADGGYIVQRFCCRGQKDYISFWSFSTWQNVYGSQPLFGSAAEQLRMTQHRLLFPPTEEAQ